MKKSPLFAKLTPFSLTSSIATLAIFAAYATPATAQSVGLNFATGADPGAGGTNQSFDLAPGDTAGVIPIDNWNNLHLANGILNSITDNSGSVISGASATWASNGTYQVTTTPAGGDFLMMDSHLDGRGTGFGTTNINPSITVSGLAAEFPNGYQVYAYFDAITTTNVVQAHYTIGSETYYYTDGANFNGTFIQDTGTSADTRTVGANYALFTQVSGDQFTLTAFEDPTAANGNDPNGFRAELQAVEIVAVPEPAGALLLAFGGIALAARRRRAV